MVRRSRQLAINPRATPSLSTSPQAGASRCQVNERVALGKPEVKKAFADANVVLMRADWTRYDDSITQTLTSLGRSGVPTYVLYVPGEQAAAFCPKSLLPAS